MSSFDFRGIRVATNDPVMQWIVEQQKKLVKMVTEGQVAALDSENEDIWSDAQDMETANKYHSELSGQHLFKFIKDYYAPFEPDGNFLTCWIRGISLGNSIRDISSWVHDAKLYGDPTLVNGNLDLGTQTHGVKSVALRLNRPTSNFENREYLQIPEVANMRFAVATTGFSLFFRIRPWALAQQGGRDPTLYAKIDDSTPSNGVMVQLKSDGKVLVIVLRSGVVTAKETAINTIVPGNIYEIFVTFTVSTSAITILINGVSKTLTTFAGSVNWQSNLNVHDTFLFRRGLNDYEGFLYADLYDFKSYLNYIVTPTEALQHFNNKWTISNIAFGHVMIMDHFATYTGAGGNEP